MIPNLCLDWKEIENVFFPSYSLRPGGGVQRQKETKSTTESRQSPQSDLKVSDFASKSDFYAIFSLYVFLINFMTFEMF